MEFDEHLDRLHRNENMVALALAWLLVAGMWLAPVEKFAYGLVFLYCWWRLEFGSSIWLHLPAKNLAIDRCDELA